MREPRQYEAPLCAQVGGDIWFPEQGGDHTVISTAKSICNQCNHRVECAEWGIHYERFGIWGGLTNFQRNAIRRKRKIKLPREKREDIAKITQGLGNHADEGRTTARSVARPSKK